MFILSVRLHICFWPVKINENVGVIKVTGVERKIVQFQPEYKDDTLRNNNTAGIVCYNAMIPTNRTPLLPPCYPLVNVYSLVT